MLITILNWNQTLMTLRCIESLLNLNTGIYFEIAVVDNNSSDLSVRQLKNVNKKIRLFWNHHNLGFAEGLSIAVSFGLKNKFELIWLLNNDAIVGPMTLNKLVAAYESNKNAIYGSLVRNKSGLVYPTLDEDHYAKSIASFGLVTKPVLQEFESVNGASMIVPFHVIQNYGWKKTDFFLYQEEVDYCNRLRAVGINSYIALDSIVHHDDGGSFINEKLGYVRSYYQVRNYLFYEYDQGIINKLDIIKKWGGFL